MRTPGSIWSRASRRESHRRATLPPGRPGSTIAEAGLNFRVRNGNGCGPCSMGGGKNIRRPSIAEYLSGPAIDASARSESKWSSLTGD